SATHAGAHGACPWSGPEPDGGGPGSLQPSPRGLSAPLGCAPRATLPPATQHLGGTTGALTTTLKIITEPMPNPKRHQNQIPCIGPSSATSNEAFITKPMA